MGEKAKFTTSTFRSILMATMVLSPCRVSVDVRLLAKLDIYREFFKLFKILIPLKNCVREIHSFIGR